MFTLSRNEFCKDGSLKTFRALRYIGLGSQSSMLVPRQDYFQSHSVTSCMEFLKAYALQERREKISYTPTPITP